MVNRRAFLHPRLQRPVYMDDCGLLVPVVPAWRRLLRSTDHARTIGSTGHRDKSTTAGRIHPPPRNNPASCEAVASTTEKRFAPARSRPPLRPTVRANPATWGGHRGRATSRGWPQGDPEAAPADAPSRGLRRWVEYNPPYGFPRSRE